jgi:hypothetical protein
VPSGIGKRLRLDERAAATTPATTVQRLTERLGLAEDAVGGLDATHAALWELEDRCRLPGVSDELLAETKRAIDDANARRHRLIDAIDASAPAPAAAPGVTRRGHLYGQTIGELVDVLLILGRKVDALTGLVADPVLSDARRRDYAGGLELCRRKADHLARVADQMFVDIAAACASLPPRADPKLYSHGELRDLSGKLAQ